ncbi:alpha/beta hydrolase [Streptomyces sp. RLB1-33]|uniref:alpha/beta hydrolase n=1 Tax=Streptomyces mirabilis TaxID=68239 RepID=UPI00143E4AD2|nr:MULTISPECIES: alpha/beta hydrolase [Streptomyces]QIY68705.1 alpha/beta hydrolase [Streptomyces sp. RLB1-33]QUW84519.1 alpha/beta hydrolase [Streptomyces mirabilis]
MSTGKVSFPHGGHQVVGNVFLPPGFDETKKYPAIVAPHPFGAVKEQASGLYAERLAGQGYITLAYDASHYGESGGEPRLFEVPGDRVEDIRCAVDYFSDHPQVDPERIGALGICASGGYTVNAAQTEARIKAVATVSAFNVGDARRNGVPRGLFTEEFRVQRLKEIGEQRTKEAAGEPLHMINFVPMSAEEIDENTPELYREVYDYYRTPRAQHPNAPGKYAFTSLDRQMAFDAFTHVESISPRPLLMIAGSEADTLYFSREAIDKANEPKEPFVIDGATHIDMCDRPQFVPQAITKLTDFYAKYL